MSPQEELAAAHNTINRLIERFSVDVFRRELCVQEGEAKVLAALYSAGGRGVSMETLRAASSPDLAKEIASNVVRVRVCRLRRVLNDGAIITVPVGYRLSQGGMEEVRAILGDLLAVAA